MSVKVTITVVNDTVDDAVSSINNLAEELSAGWYQIARHSENDSIVELMSVDTPAKAKKAESKAKK